MKLGNRNKYIVYRYFFYIICLMVFGAGMLLAWAVMWLGQGRGVLPVIILLGAYGGFLMVLYQRLYRKYKEIQKMLRLFVEGYFSDEFWEMDLQISPLMEQTTAIVAKRLDKEKHLNMAKKQAQYLALQNQINPHFLYNTLEGIRSEALCAGMDSVAEMTEALATFFRYTISNVDRLVTLEDELENIENYYIIQQFRFGEKLSLKIEYDEEDMDVLDLRMPKLTLQPIVENSIYHGIERKIGKGNLKVRVGTTKERLRIVISDDGTGVEKEKLEELNSKMRAASLEDVESEGEKRGGIALINVNNRIKLLFGERYGVQLYSVMGLGTDVEITLPIIRENWE